MDSTYLRRLRRTELQKLAKDNKVKANLKSEVIIDILLQRFSGIKTRIEDKDRTSSAQLTSASKVNPEALSNRTHRPPNFISAEEPRHRVLPDFDGESQSGNVEPAGHISVVPSDDSYLRRNTNAELTRDPRHDIFYPDSPPDYSKREDLPADEDLVKETVEMIAVIDRDNQMILERIMKVRAAASELRSRAKAIRAVIRAEDLNRIRIMTYLTYWQPIKNNWSFHDVWYGKIKIRHPDDLAGVTSSDEEDMEEVQVNQNATDSQSNPSEQVNGSAVATSGFDNESAMRLPSPPMDMDPAMRNIVESSNVVGQKRLRNSDDVVEDAELDDLRYTPRRRTQDNEPQTPEKESKTVKAELLERLECLSPPTPTPVRVDKGKERMTAEQVEKLEMEHAAERERFLAEITAENFWPRPVAERLDLNEPRASTSRQRIQTNPPAEPLRFDSDNPTFVLQQPFTGLPTELRGVGMGLSNSRALSLASQQPRPTRRSTRKGWRK